MVNKKILNITPYQPGKPIEEVKRELGLKEVIKLASNENSLGASPRAVVAISKALNSLNRYPEGSCFYLRASLSKALKVSTENLIFGNGSDEIIDIIIKAFSEDNDEILTGDVTFLEYKIIARQNCRRVRVVPLIDFKYDLVGMLKTLTPRTKIVFIANPNNPTGTYLNRKELDNFLSQVSGEVMVVLDEAYLEFVGAADFKSGTEYLKKYKNLIVLRTFSKIYGLAGLRIGYGISSAENICYLERVRQPFNVNSLAQIGATAALGDKVFLKRATDLVRDGKSYFYAELKKLKLKFVPTQANFVLIDLEQDSGKAFKGLLQQGVIVRELKQYNLHNFIRVTVGTKKENTKFIKELKYMLKSEEN